MGKTYEIKQENLGSPYPIRLDEKTEKLVEMIMIRDGETKANVIRRLVRDGAERELSEETMDSIAYVIRQTMKSVLEPIEDRIMKMHGKVGIASATSMYVGMMVFEELGKNGIVLHDAARKKAIEFIKTPLEQLRTIQAKEVSNE